MTDNDLIQIWTISVDTPAGHDWGPIKTRTVETVDFNTRTITTHTKGTHEGDRINSRGTTNFHPASKATPQSAARWRRANGYTRIG